jgi:CspA family cold shock protein
MVLRVAGHVLKARKDGAWCLQVLARDFGYGFFEVEDGRDLFVHVSQVKRAGFSALTQGQRARFELGSNARIGQPMAIDLQLLEPIISPKVTPTAHSVPTGGIIFAQDR